MLARADLTGYTGNTDDAGLSLQLRDIELCIDQQIILQGLDLDLPAASWTCLLGASGVGKTSLLKLLAGLMPAAQVRGRISRQSPEAEPETAGWKPSGQVAYMAQQDLLLPWLTVAANVALGPRLRGEQPQPQRVQKLLAAVGLAGYEQRLPASLSGGQRQRVALARTLLEDRPLVLLDEPFAALDAIARYRLQELAARLLRGRTVLLVTHDPLEALRLGHAVYVLSGQPARLESALYPPDTPPRAADNPALPGLHKTLLLQLAQEH